MTSLANNPFADTNRDGLYVSTDLGSTWRDAGLLGKQISAVAIGHDASDAIVYAGEGNLYPGPSTGGVWRLDPGSTDWAYKGPTNTIVTRIAVDPRDPYHLYVGSSSNHLFTIDRGLFESHDGGETWECIYPDTYVIALELDPRDPDIVYLSDGAGLYRSLDGGASWAEYDRHPTGAFYTLALNYAGVPTVFAGTGDGIFRRRLGALSTITSTAPATMRFTTTRGTTVTLALPVGAVTETIDLLYTEVPAPAGYASDLVFAGHAFALRAFDAQGKRPSLTFEVPVTVTVRYTDTDVVGINADQLQLLTLADGQWTDETCGDVRRFPTHRQIAVPVCRVGVFGLFQTRSYVYLPLVLR